MVFGIDSATNRIVYQESYWVVKRKPVNLTAICEPIV
jgi:hypothetical protein